MDKVLLQAVVQNGIVSLITSTNNSGKIVQALVKSIKGSSFRSVVAPNYFYSNIEEAQQSGYYNIQTLLAIVARGTRADGERGVQRLQSQLLVISSDQINYYDFTIFKFAEEFKLFLLIISPTADFGTPFSYYNNKLIPIGPRIQENIITLKSDDILDAVKEIKPKGKTLILCENEVRVTMAMKQLQENYGQRYFVGTFIFTNNLPSNFILLGVKLSNNALEIGYFDNIFVDSTIEYQNIGNLKQGLGSPTTIEYIERAGTEYDILANNCSQLIILGRITKNIPLISSVERTVIDDVLMILCRNNPFASYPAFITDNDVISSRDKLVQMGMLDEKFRPTDIGDLAQFYSWNSGAGLFLYYWVHEGQELFPGIVIGAFLEQLPDFQYQNKQNITNSLDIYLWAWHDLVATVKGKVMEKKLSDEVKKWTKAHIKVGYFTFIKMVQLIAKKSRDFKVTFFGQFHVDQAILKSLPILERVYYLYSSNKIANGEYEMNNGDVYKDEKSVNTRLAILKVQENMIVTSLPLPSEPAEINEPSTVELPLIDENIISQKWKPGTVQLVTVPIKRIVWPES